MIRTLSRNYCETTRTVTCFLSVVDKTGGDVGPINTNCQYTAPFTVFQWLRLDAMCLHINALLRLLSEIYFCLDGSGEGGGEAYVWLVVHWKWAWPSSIIAYNLLCFDVFCFERYVVRV